MTDNKEPVEDKVKDLAAKPLKDSEADVKGGGKTKGGFDDVEQSPGIGR